MKTRAWPFCWRVFAICLAWVLMAGRAEARVILQYFETDWSEIDDRMVEIATLGYDAVWLPPPTKGAEGRVDVGFSVFDRFDLGDKDQRGTVRTRYGTTAEAKALVATAHRLGVRVIFDLVMNHTANPSLIENPGVTLAPVALDQYPGLSPLDFHVLPGRSMGGGAFEVARPLQLGGGTFVLRPGTNENPEASVAAVPIPPGTTIAGYTHLVRAPRVIFDGDLTDFENQHYSLLGLADLAADQNLNSTPSNLLDDVNALTGTTLPRFVRTPNCLPCYPSGSAVSEDVREYLQRWVTWLSNELSADGFRLDAVRHVPESFFAENFPNDPIAFNQAIQNAYDLRTGRTDTNDLDGLGDAQIFGESFTGDIDGELNRYFQTGMQLLNFPLFFKLTALFSASQNGGGDLGQLSFPQDPAPSPATALLNAYGGLGAAAGVAFTQSHDSTPPDGQPNLALAFTLTRPGDSVVFFDGNNPDPKSFVQPGRVDALADLGSRVVTTLVDVSNRFARGRMENRFVDDDVYVYERVANGPPVGATLLVVLCDNIGSDARNAQDGSARLGEFDARPLVVTAFPPGTVLIDYSGNSPVRETTVISPNAVGSGARQRALAEFVRSSSAPLPQNYGLVYVAAPSGPDKGYALYAPGTPRGPSNGARAVSILQDNQRVPDFIVQTAPEKRTPFGQRVPARTISYANVSGSQFELRVRTDYTATRVFARFDGSLSGQPSPLSGTPMSGSPEALLDGWFPVAAMATAPDGDKVWSLANIPTTTIAPGGHLISVRAVTDRPGAPLLYSDFHAPIWIPENMTTPTIVPPDRDGDGVENDRDNCPLHANSGQSDFDEDGIGDLCDVCSVQNETEPSAVDQEGCPILPESVRMLLDHLVNVIAERQAPAPSDDFNSDGAVDVVDLVAAIRGEHAR